jgi:hypothetical protein
MNDYEAKQAARRERYQERAAKAERESNQASAHAHTLAGVIPFGQPVLVGHHSESRHRAHIKRTDQTMRKAVEADKKASYYTDKAASVGSGGISSDDPDAGDKLKTKLAKREKMHADMKAINQIVRKHKNFEARYAAVIEAGYSAAVAQGASEPDFMQKVGFPSYALTNNSAEIRRLKKRIAEQEKAGARAGKEIQGRGYTMRQDTDENRIMFEFPGKPDAETRNVLKQNGFKWSPSRTAWVRKWTANAEFAATMVRHILDSLAD